MQDFKSEWNTSYMNKDNFVFYPDENIIRFVSKYIKKRVGLNNFISSKNFDFAPKVLDFGCGIGRHIWFLNDFELDCYGFDLSEDAINSARDILTKLGLDELLKKIITANITSLPYEDKYFDFMLSHGVIDSMPFDIAMKGMKELHRCLKDEGKVYFDLISDVDSSFNGKDFESIVSDDHEKGTIQSYFNKEKIDELIQGLFSIVDIELNTKTNTLNKNINARWSLVVEKK